MDGDIKNIIIFFAILGACSVLLYFVDREFEMNRFYDSVDPTDVQQNESLRQSELVSRLSFKINEELGEEGTTVIQLAINKWLLDNDMKILHANTLTSHR